MRWRILFHFWGFYVTSQKINDLHSLRQYNTYMNCLIIAIKLQKKHLIFKLKSIWYIISVTHWNFIGTFCQVHSYNFSPSPHTTHMIEEKINIYQQTIEFSTSISWNQQPTNLFSPYTMAVSLPINKKLPCRATHQHYKNSTRNTSRCFQSDNYTKCNWTMEVVRTSHAATITAFSRHSRHYVYFSNGKLEYIVR